MRRSTIPLVLVLGAAASGCKPDEVILTEDIPSAGVRFINAVPDTGGAFGMDLRFVDIVESNSHFRITFRNSPAAAGGVTAATSVQYKNTRAGSRKFVIFLDDTLQSIAQVKMKDTTATFDAGKNYTVMLWGGARSGSNPAMRLNIIEENVADPGQNVALRVINATGAPIDVRQYVSTPPAAATWSSVPPLSASAYVNVSPAQIRFNVQPAGGGTPLFADALALIGAPASSSAGSGGGLDISALPGTTVAGSAISLIVFPRSTPGTRTPQTAAFQVPAGVFVWDRRPPRGF